MEIGLLSAVGVVVVVLLAGGGGRLVGEVCNLAFPIKGGR